MAMARLKHSVEAEEAEAVLRQAPRDVTDERRAEGAVAVPRSTRTVIPSPAKGFARASGLSAAPFCMVLPRETTERDRFLRHGTNDLLSRTLLPRAMMPRACRTSSLRGPRGVRPF